MNQHMEKQMGGYGREIIECDMNTNTDFILFESLKHCPMKST